MALATLARWLGASSRDGVQPERDEQCGECGRFFAVKDLKRARCNKCDSGIVVCEEHRVAPTCLNCGNSVSCAVCDVFVKERCTNDVFCAACESEIAVCDKHLARPVCSKCRGR